VLSTDLVVDELYKTADVRSFAVQRWGQKVLSRNGDVDREVIAQLVFDSETEKQWLEQLLWPKVKERVLEWVESSAQLKPRPVAGVVEVPLLFESGMEDMFDVTVSITIDSQVRRTRLTGNQSEHLLERTSHQFSQEQKAALADYVIANDGSLSDFQAKLAKLLAQL